MQASGFFGDLSPFQIIISVLTIVNAIAVAWGGKVFAKRHVLILPQKLALITDGKAPTCCQVILTVINNRSHVCSVEKIDGLITDDKNNQAPVIWSRFYKQVEDGVQDDGAAAPFSVPPNSGRTILLELKVEQSTPFPWETGRYDFSISCHLHAKRKPLRREKLFNFIRELNTFHASRAISLQQNVRYEVDLS